MLLLYCRYGGCSKSIITSKSDTCFALSSDYGNPLLIKQNLRGSQDINDRPSCGVQDITDVAPSPGTLYPGMQYMFYIKAKNGEKQRKNGMLLITGDAYVTIRSWD